MVILQNRPSDIRERSVQRSGGRPPGQGVWQCTVTVGQSGPAAEDAAQEASIIADQQIGQLHEPSALGTWLWRIFGADTDALKAHRSRRFRQRRLALSIGLRPG